MIEIIPVGGYSEIGRNCTIVKWNDEAVMLDFGLMMENYVALQEDTDYIKTGVPKSVLIRENAVPDLDAVKDELKYIKALCISHAHLDHVGAVPFFANKINAPIYGTPFTIEVLKTLMSDKKQSPQTQLLAKKENSKFKVSKNIKIQFINVTHSTPQSVIIAVHTPDGVVVYANDFKLDENPGYGKKTDIGALRMLKNVKVLIMDSLYSLEEGKAASESEAKKKLEEALLETDYSDRNIVVTTFASQIYRLRAIVEVAEELGRKPVFVGRSMAKYLEAAKKAGIVDFEKRAEFVKFGGAIEKYFKTNPNTKEKLFIVTGHQGEPKAVLSRMAQNTFFPFQESDLIVFSCNVIPTEECFRNRERLEGELANRNLEIIKGIHASGHGCQEDHKELIWLLNPEHIIPTHGDPDMLAEQKRLCQTLGYKEEKIHVLRNFSRVYIK